MVEQFGFAIILSFSLRTDALTSGTTNFLSGSIRHAEELSTTVVPTSANFGAYSVDVAPPAEKRAISGFIAIASSGVTTLYLEPLNVMSLPLLLSEATGINSSRGKFLSSRTLKIMDPTKPVAPTTAIFIFSNFTLIIYDLNSYNRYN